MEADCERCLQYEGERRGEPFPCSMPSLLSGGPSEMPRLFCNRFSTMSQLCSISRGSHEAAVILFRQDPIGANEGTSVFSSQLVGFLLLLVRFVLTESRDNGTLSL